MALPPNRKEVIRRAELLIGGSATYNYGGCLPGKVRISIGM